MKIVIIGTGPAGLMCAVKASENKNNSVILCDKNDKIGKKLYITGKGRCNVCNNTSIQNFLENVVNNSKFLMSSLNSFTPSDTIKFFESNGTKLKTERGNRVFPQSDKASDITKTFAKILKRDNVELNLNSKVQCIKKIDNGFEIKIKDKIFNCDAVVISTGGKSYVSTGSSGDGYAFAKMLGHNVVQLKPALVPIKLKDFDSNLAGLTLKNVTVTVKVKDKIFSQFGEMLFTHSGVSGPIILTLSSFLNKYTLNDCELIIDLKPAISSKELEDRLINDFKTFKHKSFKNYLKELLPLSLIDYFIKRMDINYDKQVCLINKEERKRIVDFLKNMNFSIACLEDLDYAIVTSGGVDVKEINPKTMESKICNNLFFVGEVIDVDALTGGFNIQIALSTGFCAGKYLSEIGG
jgi:predicted Rossmann fold flavoprotein